MIENNDEITKNKFISIDKRAIATNLGEILVVDDDNDYTKRIRRNLVSNGYNCETVNSFTQMGKKLDQFPNKFPLVFCDNIQGNPEINKHIRGSEILLSRPDWFNNRKFILVTGWNKDLIEEWNELESRGAKLLEKGPGHVEELLEVCRTIFTPPAIAIANEIENYSEMLISEVPVNLDLFKPKPNNKLVSKTKEKINKYLASFKEQDTRYFYFGNKAFSPKEMIQEINEDSEIGVDMIEMILDSALRRR
jgi:hypothetical protein